VNACYTCYLKKGRINYLFLRARNLFFVVAFFLFQQALFSQTFYRSYGQTTVNEGGQSMATLSDGNLVVAGHKGDSAFVMKINPTGDVLWTRTFKPQAGAQNIIQGIAVTPDNFIIGTGNTNSGVNFYSFYFKIDLNGTIQWMKQFAQTQTIYFRRMWAKSSSEYILHGAYFDNNSNPYGDEMWKRIDAATGAVIYTSPRINISTPAYVDDMYSSVIGRGEASYITGRMYLSGNTPTGMRAYITKADAAGTYLWSRYLMQTTAQSARVYGTDIIYDNDSLIVGYTGDVNAASGNYTVGLIKTDTLGIVKWAKNYQLAGSSTEFCLKVLTTATGYVMTGVRSGGASDFFILSVDKQGNLLWAKAYGTTANETLTINNTSNSTILNGDIYFTGATISGANSDLVVARVDSDGNLGCLTPATINVTVTNNPINSSLCTVSTLTASVAVSTSTAFGSVPMNNNCPVLNLGNDTSICTPHTLNATVPGATQYTWSDGSALPALNVTVPGTYWVTVLAGCCIVRDTIVIASQAPQANVLAVPSTCSLDYSFSVNTSNTITSYQWDFGDGASSASAAPSHGYANAGTYTASVTIITACGTATFDTVITVQPSNVQSGFTYIISPCLGNEVHFSNTSANATDYEWHFGDALTSTSQDPVHTYSAPGTYTVILIAHPATPCADTTSSIVTVYAPPQAQFTAMLVNCSYDVNFTGTSLNSTQYTWDFGDTNTSALQDPVHTYNAPGTYTITLIADSAGVCADTISQTITIPDIYPLAAFSTSSFICADSTVFSNSSVNAQNYLWDFGDGSAISAAVSPVHTYGAGTYTVQLIAYNTTCNTTDTVQHVITVNALPTLSVSDTSICIGGTAVLNVSGALSYLWSDSQIGSPVQVSPLVTTSYTVTGTDGNTCSSTAIVLVTVNLLPVLTVSDTAICTGQTVVLTAVSSVSDYVWSTGETTDQISVSPVSFTSYAVTSTDANGCTASAIADVTVNSLPVVMTNQAIICIGSAAELTAEGASTYLWSTGETSGTIFVSPLSDNVYAVTGTDNNGCSASSTALVTVLPVPVASLINDTVLCSVTSLLLNVADGGNTVLWNTGATSNSITATQPGEYWVMLSNGICSDRDTVNVQFFDPPDLGSDQTHCEGEVVTLSANSANPTYVWSTGSVSSSATIGTSGMYWVDVSLGTCYARDSVTIKFLAVPNVNLGSDTALCDQQFTDSLLLDAGAMPSVTYLWNTGDTTQMIAASSVGTYWVLVANGICTDMDTLTISRFEGIELGEKQLLCAQEELMLIPKLARNVPSVYTWSTGETTPSISVGGPGTYIVFVDQGECIFVDSVEVAGSISEGALYVPNTFTPGPDYINDVFYAEGEAISSFTMKIYNRWGELIFESHKQSDGWDGTYKGKLVQMDTYIWIIDYITDCSEEMSIRKSGVVTVIR
jgi:gliding motility-associated-like protein